MRPLSGSTQTRRTRRRGNAPASTFSWRRCDRAAGVRGAGGPRAGGRPRRLLRAASARLLPDARRVGEDAPARGEGSAPRAGVRPGLVVAGASSAEAAVDLGIEGAMPMPLPILRLAERARESAWEVRARYAR